MDSSSVGTRSDGAVKQPAEGGAVDATSEAAPVPVEASDQDAIGGGCTTSVSCQGMTAICNQATRQCVQCLASSECPVPTPYCNPQSFQCSASCTSDAECSTKLPYCSPQSAECVQCRGNSDCSGGTPYCSVPDGGAASCVQCLMSSQCPTRKPTCTDGKCN